VKNVIILKGLPASGKSTWARKQLAEHPGQYKRINKDDLRAMLDGGKWSRDNEKFVLQTRDTLILDALQNGKNVIVDDTNLHPKHEAHIRALVKGQARVTVKFFEASVGECVSRDLQRQRSVGAHVIKDMHDRWLAPPPEQYTFDPDLEDAYIFDLDGTLAHMQKRGPYDWGRVGEDSVDANVVRTLRTAKAMGYTIIILSGRDGICKPETQEWLATHNIPYDELYLRAPGDNRKDSVIKEELFEEYIRPRYNIIAVYDDRDQVVEMWRQKGLSCYQVNYGAF